MFYIVAHTIAYSRTNVMMCDRLGTFCRTAACKAIAMGCTTRPRKVGERTISDELKVLKILMIWDVDSPNFNHIFDRMMPMADQTCSQLGKKISKSATNV